MRERFRPYSPGLNEVIEDWSEVELEPYRALIPRVSATPS